MIGNGGKKSTNNLGIYDDLASCEAEITNPSAGNFFMNSDTSTIWYYSGTSWINSGATSSGDMLSSIYDPNSISSNAFSRSNHTGTQHISTVTDLQNSLDDKQDTITGAVSNVVDSDFVAKRVLVSTSLGKISTSAITSTELDYLDGASSNIQNQLTDLTDNKQDNITGGITKVLTSNFVKSKAIVSDSDGKAVTSDTTSTEIGYVAGVTSNIQDQINAIDTTASTERTGYTGGTVADGNIGQKVTETAYQSMAIGVTTYSLKTVHPLTAGVWMIYGNVKWDSSDTTTGGWLKACLSESENTFTNYNTMQIDKGTNEADCGGSLFPLYLTVTEDTDMYLNLEREFSTFNTYMYLNILAVRIA